MVSCLFLGRGNLCDHFEQRKLALKSEVEALDSDYLLKVSEEELIHHLVDKYSVAPLAVDDDQIYVNEPTEVDVDVSQDPARAPTIRGRSPYVRGVAVTIAVPFSGDAELFFLTPSTYTLNPPRGQIVNQEVHLRYDRVERDAGELRHAYTEDLSSIKRYLGWVNQDVEQFNTSLATFIRQVVTERKQKLTSDFGLVSALGIPIRRRQDLPATYVVPTIRKKPRIERPKVRAEALKPEPTLAVEEYESILEIIHNMALVMERSPKTFAKLKEEEIRDHFLLHLNGHYEGQATGETFNCAGKTDILIRVEDKNVFIAECKFWKGEKKLLESLDQLLGYTSWRDTKTALLIFNRTAAFSTVLSKIDGAAKSHSCFKRGNALKSTRLGGETTFSYVFHQPNDENREMILTIVAFDVPAQETAV